MDSVIEVLTSSAKQHIKNITKEDNSKNVKAQNMEGTTRNKEDINEKPEILPSVSQQSSGQDCSCDAVGKAIQNLLHKQNINSNQDEIIQELRSIFKQTKKGRSGGEDPSIFSGQEISIKETDKTERELIVEVSVKTTGKGVEKEDWTQDLSLPRKLPLIEEDIFKQEVKNPKSEMVLTWRIKDNTKEKGAYKTHCIYCSRYHEITRLFECINSWGRRISHPKLHDTRIVIVDFVSIEIKEKASRRRSKRTANRTELDGSSNMKDSKQGKMEVPEDRLHRHIETHNLNLISRSRTR